jgi:hypothetical protein
MSPLMMKRYVSQENPLVMDEEIRKTFKVPRNRFYSVSMNTHNYGAVIVDQTRVRTVAAVKLSKSPSP